MLNERKLVIDFLTAKGVIDSHRLETVLAEQEKTGEGIILLLTRAGAVTDGALDELIIEELGWEYNPLPDRLMPELSLLDPDFARRHRLLPLEQKDDVLVLGIDTPLNFLSLNYFSHVMGKRLAGRLIRAEELDPLLNKYFPAPSSEMMVKAAAEADAPVIRLVNQLITDANQRRASDIHIEPMRDSIRIRYRIDGMLREFQSPEKNIQPTLISRIKLLAGMDLSEKRLPQDGRIRTGFDSKELDLRISTLPAQYGESVVMRILDRRILRVEDLGFSLDQLNVFKRLTTTPHGIILVTGPTGSGKSTSLYAVLQGIDRAEKKILTVEDPVEYQMEGINQVQVKPNIGLSFARVLRSMLRQAPDVIMVGEIRDLETAHIAIQSALTGHLIFSTLHTNDAASAITRLVDMGIKPYLVAATLRAVLAQRLIRMLCPACRQPYPAPRDEAKILAVSPDTVLYRAVGCPECSQTGYRGRTGIFEFLVIDDDIRGLAHRHEPASLIRESARKKGMMTLREHARNKVLQGLTTVQELVRITQSDVVDGPVPEE